MGWRSGRLPVWVLLWNRNVPSAEVVSGTASCVWNSPGQVQVLLAVLLLPLQNQTDLSLHSALWLLLQAAGQHVIQARVLRAGGEDGGQGGGWGGCLWHQRIDFPVTTNRKR